MGARGAIFRAWGRSACDGHVCGANLLNWLGNWVLIYGKLGMPAMGVDGSALSTVIARLFMALALVGFAWRYERNVAIRFSSIGLGQVWRN